MRFRTLRSIEFQGLCSRNWNFSHSENCIFGIYGPEAFCRFLTRLSKDSQWRYKTSLFQVHNRKNWRESWYYAVSNIAFYWISRPLQQKLEIFMVWNLYFLNLQSIRFLSISYSSIKRQSMKIQSSLFQVHNRKNWRES
jgi:hypothetical protein